MSGRDTDEGWIGRRIGHLRRERGWTLAVLGQKVDLSSTQLSRIESGARQSSVGTLIEVARAFGVTLSELVADEPTSAFHLVRGGERTPRESANGVLTPLSGNYPGLEAIHLTVPASTAAPSAQHSGEEWLYILCGPVEVTIGSEVLVLQPGDAVHFPSHTPHSVRNVGKAPAEVLLVSTAS